MTIENTGEFVFVIENLLMYIFNHTYKNESNYLYDFFP